METPEVLVLGASAAGLAAARSAARDGARVVLVEARDEIGTPEPPAVVAFDFLWVANDLAPRQDETRLRLEGARLQSPAGHALDLAAPLSVLDRARFDRRLAREAAAAGASIRLGTGRVSVRPDGSVVAPGFEARPRVLVFADGPGTLARRFLPTMRHPESLLWGAAQRIARPGGDRERLLHLTLGAHVSGGRSQLVPLGDEQWLHWTFYRGPPSEARARARRALELDLHLRGWDPALLEQARFLGVAPDAVVAIPHRLVGNGVMAVGGAAAQGGLEMGVAAGEMAGSVAARAARAGRADERALLPYERAWKARHQSGYRALRRWTTRLARLDDADLDRLLAPWAGWRIPIRDFVGLAHPDVRRRAEAIGKFAARNPHALPGLARVGVQAMWPF